ncbi:hypothetical protein [Streptomyces aureocirculatus]|uniref:hypothetical protein n=1 Tax=Streptomyces aureocirculatus TaxID=67275 RepID=UPI001B806352|nr:hypothetical protein [Streptomyces aureocirculatus]
MNRTVARSARAPVDGVAAGAEPGPGPEAEADGTGPPEVSVSARRTAPSSNGLLWAVPPESALANCQAPNAPAAVPTATQAAVPAALHHFPTPPPSPTVP